MRLALSERMRKSNITHGMSTSRLYQIFRGIEKRCQNKICPAYKDYGGRGIKVEWQSFEQFRDDMGASYEEHAKEHGRENTSINRIDNDGNYNKTNCKWSTPKEQARNRRSNRRLIIKGISKTVSEWSETTGISQFSIVNRIDRLGWPIEKAVTKNIRAHKVYGKSV